MMIHLKLLKTLPISFILFFVSCNKEQVKENVPEYVKTTSVAPLQTSLSKNYPARIRAVSDAKLAFRIAGPVLQVNVKEGDVVEKGQVLAQIDPRDYKIQLEATEAKYQEVKSEVERITALHKKNKISENDYDKAVSGLKQITAKYKAHKNALEDTRLKAPFSGQINKIYFEAGEMVDAGMHVVSMIDTQQYEIVTHLPASDYLKKELFTGFTCRSSSSPGQEWPLELRNIVSQANLNGLYPIFFNLKNTNNNLILPGMSAEVIIEYQPEHENLYEIPSSAIFEKNNLSHVWIFQESDSTINSGEVEIIKIKSSGKAVVKGNFEESDRVISAGVNGLQEGQKVKELPPPTESNVGNLL